ncbi:MAG: hypothetical protein HYW65_00200 [Candidatus Liptonbacteria bacterium]|nr:hypothetical protein [Candidatus Liptonbacteria bacterium]
MTPETILFIYSATKFIAFLVMIVSTILFLLAKFGTNFSTEEQRKKWLINLVLAVFSSTMCVFSTSGVLPQSCLVDAEGKVITSFPRGTIMWTWNYARLARGTTLLSYAPLQVEVEWVTRPDSTNVAIFVVVEKIPMPETAAKYWNALMDINSGGVKSGEEWRFKEVVRDELFRFEREKKSELSRFLDNTDEEQQKAFEKFVRGVLDPRLLEKGMRIRAADFSNPKKKFPSSEARTLR